MGIFRHNIQPYSRGKYKVINISLDLYILTLFNIVFFFQQINDTKSAYGQISDLVNNQFIDEKVSLF